MGQSKSSKYYAANPKANAVKKKYQSEYQSTEKEKSKRASRNTARRKMVMAGRVGKNEDVNHKDGNPNNNSPSNLNVESRSKNRGRK